MLKKTLKIRSLMIYILNFKLVIPTMSATEGNAMCDKLRNKYPNKSNIIL